MTFGNRIRDVSHPHDPHEPGEDEVRHSEAVPNAVIEEVVAAAAVVDEDHDGDGEAAEGVQADLREQGRSQARNGGEKTKIYEGTGRPTTRLDFLDSLGVSSSSRAASPVACTVDWSG